MREFRPGSFQILPPVIKNLIIINVLVFLIQQTVLHVNHTTMMEDVFALHTWQSSRFRIWQFFTYMFLHDTSSILHLALNMFALWMFGSVLENLWGPKRFLIFYVVCGLGAALCHMAVLYVNAEHLLRDYYVLQQHFTLENFTNYYRKENIGAFYEGAGDVLNQWQSNPGNPIFAQHAWGMVNQFVNDNLNGSTIGASGAVFGCLAAFGYLFPNTYLYVYFAIPVKAKWVVLIYIAIELFATVNTSAGDNVAHVAHLGGALFGFLLVYFWNKTNRRTFY
ncbi:MAG TPA: rhomboid family intramembrane serine protease [Parafilimonas sp.]|nr:rhomboid family intramembrane serine protease [Parafilimonas sp.]